MRTLLQEDGTPAPATDATAARDQVIVDALRRHPWSTSRMLSDAILDETGGRPVISTGALWIPVWRMTPILVRLERDGRVERCALTTRTIFWNVTDLNPGAPS